MSADLLNRWLAFGQAMQKAGSELPRHLVADTKAALSAQQQAGEPVEWMSSHAYEDGPVMREFNTINEFAHGGSGQPLYTAPPRAQLLRVAEKVYTACGEYCLQSGIHLAGIDLAAIVDAIQTGAQKAPEEMVRYCPECNHTGPVGSEYHDCCPDGSHARDVPKKFAEICSATFLMCLREPHPAPVNQQMLAALKALLQWIDDWCETGPDMDFERVEQEADAAIAAAEAAQREGVE